MFRILVYSKQKEAAEDMQKDEIRVVKYDAACRVEAYQFQGVMQSFPNHFHDYYVVGVIERGRRTLLAQNREYALAAGDLLLLNPRDSHACQPADGETLDYRCLNIPIDVMREAAREITGADEPPVFNTTVVYRSELADTLIDLHGRIMRAETGFGKEELFFFLLAQLLTEYANSGEAPEEPVGNGAIEAVCAFLEQNYDKPVSLDVLGERAGYSKYHLLRSFTKQKGISPYSYLETVRIGKAKELLQAGVLPAETAARTGFSDQSHLGNVFKRYIGLTPKQYWRIFQQERGNTVPEPNGAEHKEGEPEHEPIG
jgi:AraC-like DNA-binding protein/quercetin dioxygenase-like cupin family protein